MTIARLKLIQYLAVFRKHIPGDSTHQLHQTMDGIEEVSIIQKIMNNKISPRISYIITKQNPKILSKNLIVFILFHCQLCELLKIKEKIPYTLPTPVEPAFEANEAAVTPNRKIIDKKVTTESQHNITESADSNTPKLVRVPIGSLPPLQISPSKQINSNNNSYKNKTINEIVQCHDIECIGNADGESSSTNPITKIRYEIPENRLSRTATLILGNRKELEMHEFSTAKHINVEITENDDNNRRTPKLPEIDPSGDRQPLD